MIFCGTPAEVFADEERLKSIGLSLPPVTEFMHRLHEANSDINPDILDIETACDEICRFLGEK